MVSIIASLQVELERHCAKKQSKLKSRVSHRTRSQEERS